MNPPLKLRLRPFSAGRIIVGLLRATKRRLSPWLPLEGVRPLEIWEAMAHGYLGRVNLTWITPTLAVGGRYAAAHIPRLARMGVTAVVDLRAEDRDDEEELARWGIHFLHLPTPDNHPLSLADMSQGVEWVQRELAGGGRVLIHCQHGIGRSVLLACAVLLDGERGPDEALALIQARRWQAGPGPNQLAALYEFGRQLQSLARRAG